MSTVIKVENISKAYQIGEFSTGTITNDIDRWWKLMRGKEDPYLKIGETNDRSTKGTSDVVWSLRDISFEIQQGDAVGIIGKNGAGKSTLLKILSRVTTPTTGSVKLKGRIASLLEVGTGFHPELTGKENIYLNGAILGMRKHEIKKHFDAIVDFSGVERYIDTPVKRYSSGMYVRLAFAVAAHLESEILILDEVLAVGDAEFQKKALGKVGDVSKGEGRTILFVSHNMAAVKSLCTKGIVLQNGNLHFSGTSQDAVNFYQKSSDSDSLFEHLGLIDEAPGNSNIRLLKANVTSNKTDVISISTGFNIEIKFYNYNSNINLSLGIILKSIEEVVISELPCFISENKDSKTGIYVTKFSVPSNLLNAGNYYISLLFGKNQREVLYHQNQVLQFEILNETIGTNSHPLPGFIRININADTNFLGNG